jgi:DNA anti-recombination protein RmuC
MKGKAEKRFRDLGKRLDQMIADLDELKVNLREKYGDRWEEINRNKSKLEDEINQFKERHKARFEEAERNLERARLEIKKAFEAIFSSKPNDEKSDPPPQGESSEH